MQKLKNPKIAHIFDSSICRVIVALLGGALLSTSLAFLGYSFTAWIGLVPLLLLIKSSNSHWGLARESFTFAIIYNLVSFTWLLTIHPLTWQGYSQLESFFIAFAAWIMPSLYHSILIVAFAFLAKLIFRFSANQQNILNSILIAFIWVIIHHKIATSVPLLNIMAIPINLLAYSQFENLAFIQIANKIGAIGVEFIIVFVNLFFANMIDLNKEEIFKMKELNLPESSIGSLEKHTSNIIFIVTLALTSFLIFISGLNTKIPDGESINFGIVQGNLSAENIRGQSLDIEKIVQKHKDLSMQLKPNRDLLIWPEGAVPTGKRALSRDLTSFSINKEDAKHTLDDSETLVGTKSPKLMVFGTYVIEDHKGESKIYNSIELHENKKDNPSHFYHKRHLVPFGEYTPFLKLLPRFLKELAKSVVGDGFTDGPQKQEAVQTSIGKIGFSICFEMLFPNLIREQVISGAELIINVSDLSWFRSDLIKKQFLAASVFRAIENKKAILLASNSGYSAKISPLGNISKVSEANKETILEGKVKRNKVLSIYSKYGW